MLRREPSEVSILDGDDAHVTDGSVLLLDWCGSIVAGGAKGRVVGVLTGRGESTLVTGKLSVGSAKLLLTHVLETHVVSTTHGALVTTVSAHTLTGSGAVHVVHGVVVHVGMTAHVTGVRKVSTTSAMVTTMSTVTVSVAVVVHTEVHHALLSLVSATATTTAAATRTTGAAAGATVVILVTVLFTLQLGLDSLAVRRVADHGQDGSDVVDELHNVNAIMSGGSDSNEKSHPTHGHSLSRVGVVQSGLDDIVGKRVAQQLF